MVKMLIGLFFITMELTIARGNMIIGLLPDFVGYFLLMMGLREIAHENDFFYKNIRFSFWVGAMSLMAYVMDLIGATMLGQYQSLLMQLVLVVLEPICLLRVVRGVRQVEKDYEIDAKGKWMLAVWVVMTVLSVFALIVSGVPEISDLVGLILSFVSLGFVALFFNFRAVYTELMEELAPEAEEE